MNAVARRARPTKPSDVLVIGAGISGLTSARRLLEAGVSDLAILEQAQRLDRVGGSGLGCPGRPSDLPSLLGCGPLDPRRLDDRIQFGRQVSELVFDEREGCWEARTVGGERFLGRSVVVACGASTSPRLPDIRGIDRFAGRILHTGRWDVSAELAGRRVAVVGTGATAVQVVPDLVGRVERLKVFQRTPRWILPRPDSLVDNRFLAGLPMSRSIARQALLYANEPWALPTPGQRAVTGLIGQLGKALLRSQVRDPWTRRLLTPDHRPGDRPTLVSNEYYPALQRPNCELVTWPIATISEAGIRTADAVEHRFDCIVFATGLDSAGPGLPFAVVGRNGRTMANEWSGDVSRAYKGVSIAGFPNLFVIPEPHRAAGDNSGFLYLGSRADYVVRAITMMRTQRIRVLDVTPQAQLDADQGLRVRPPVDLRSSNGRYRSTHRPQFGSLAYPAATAEYMSLTSRFRQGDYEIEPVTAGLRPEGGLN
jgi:cation diffusion facilitator CzcD-associated flavoprotein CzcO